MARLALFFNFFFLPLSLPHVNVPNRTIGEVVTIPCVWSSHPLNLPLFFWTPFAHSGHTVVLLRNRVRLVIWRLRIHMRVRIAQQYLRRCLNVHSTSLIQVKFLRFQQGLSVTGYAIPIFHAALNYITEVLDSTGTDFGFKIPFY